eukprot:1161007-Pelagomonas_calceolata.AAC.7
MLKIYILEGNTTLAAFIHKYCASALQAGRVSSACLAGPQHSQYRFDRDQASTILGAFFQHTP